MEQKLPSVWKLADITPLPNVKQVSDPKKELRPISLTLALSKNAEDFVVLDYIKPALEDVDDPITSLATYLVLPPCWHLLVWCTSGLKLQMAMVRQCEYFFLTTAKLLIL